MEFGHSKARNFVRIETRKYILTFSHIHRILHSFLKVLQWFVGEQTYEKDYVAMQPNSKPLLGDGSNMANKWFKFILPIIEVEFWVYLCTVYKIEHII